MRSCDNPTNLDEEPTISRRTLILTALATAGVSACGSAARSSKSAKDEWGDGAWNRDTRRNIKPDDENQDSIDAAKKGVASKGYLSPKEVISMQNRHEQLYKQYMNPAFMLYLEQRGLSGKVYPVLNQIMEDPDAFDYEENRYGMVVVTKRRPFKEENEDIPNDFSVEMDPSSGTIAKVGNLDLSKIMSHDKYLKQTVGYRERFMEAVEKSRDAGSDDFWKVFDEWPIGARRTEKLRQLLLKPYENVPPTMKRIFEIEHVQFPKSLIGLMEARDLGFETSDYRFRRLRRHYARQGKTYDELTKKKFKVAPGVDHEEPEYIFDKYQIIVRAHPQAKNAYLLIMAPNTPSHRETELSVDMQGRMLVRQDDGSWEADPRYENAVQRRYYADNPDAPR